MEQEYLLSFFIPFFLFLPSFSFHFPPPLPNPVRLARFLAPALIPQPLAPCPSPRLLPPGHLLYQQSRECVRLLRSEAPRGRGHLPPTRAAGGLPDRAECLSSPSNLLALLRSSPPQVGGCQVRVRLGLPRLSLSAHCRRGRRRGHLPKWVRMREAFIFQGGPGGAEVPGCQSPSWWRSSHVMWRVWIQGKPPNTGASFHRPSIPPKGALPRDIF